VEEDDPMDNALPFDPSNTPSTQPQEQVVVPPPVPTMFRWVSNKDGLVLGVPPHKADLALPKNEQESMRREVKYCVVQGCQLVRKYNWVKDPTKGACGMVHLNMITYVLYFYLWKRKVNDEVLVVDEE